MKNMKIMLVLLLLIGFHGEVCSDSRLAVKNRANSVFAEKASQRLLMDIQQVESGRIIVVGERGHILLSDNNGIVWRQVIVPTNALLVRLFFINGKTGWAVGHQQTILKTIDAGESWTLQHYSENLDQPALFDVWFRDESDGIAVGAYGLYLKTHDGGDTWQAVYQDKLEDALIGFPHFYAMTFAADKKQLYLAGELGFLASSADYGKSWQKINSPYEGSFFNITALQSGEIFVMGLRGHLFKSNDGGGSWRQIVTGTTSALQFLLSLPKERLLIVGNDGTQLFGGRYGEKFVLSQRKDRAHLAGAAFLANNQLLLVGVRGLLHLDSTDESRLNALFD